MEKINDIKCNIFISANAGSGKTKVLVDRFISLLLSGCDISKILCITYTISATQEMKNRIYGKMIEILNAINANDLNFIKQYQNYNEDSIKKNIEYALLNIEKIKIQTFHSFCTEIIRNCHSLLNVDQDFKILSEEGDLNVKLYKNHIKQDFLNEIKDENVKNSINILMHEYGKHWFEKFIDEGIINLHLFSRILKNKDQYLQVYKNYINLKGGYINLEEDCKKKLYKKFIHNEELLNLVKSCTNLKSKQSEFASQWLNMNDCDKIKNIQTLILNYHTKEFAIRKKLTPEEVNLADCIYRTLKSMFSLHSVYLTEHFLNLQQLICKKYENLKTENNVLDYDDIIYLVCHELKNTVFIEKIYQKYNHILLDEAQDMSTQQWEIIDAIFHEYTSNYQEICKTIFVVGDEKQSIYGFCGASVESFSSRFEKYKIKSQENLIPFTEIKLLTSYRSCPEILSFIDDFSKKDIIKNLSNISNSSHIPYKTDRGLVEIITIDSKKSTEQYYNDEMEDNENEQNDLNYYDEICKKILELNKEIPFNEIMVLTRNRNTNYKNFIKKAKIYNIPVQSDRESDNISKRYLLDILSIIGLVLKILPEYDFASLLKSDIFNFTDEEIMKLQKNKNFTIEYLKTIDKFNTIYQILYDIYEVSSNLREFLLYLINNETLKNKFQKYNELILNKAFEEIFKYSKNMNNIEIYLFLKSQIDDINFVSKDNFSTQLMTIHGSKGLEARVVIFIENDFHINKLQSKRTDNQYTIFSKPDYNFFTAKSRTFKNVDKMYKYRNEDMPFSQEIIQRNEDFELSEHIRLLYVAFTRAKERLILFISKNEYIT